MNICFRADASVQIGTGHIMRCLTLAQALRKKGASCYFICRDHTGTLFDLIRGHSFDVRVLATQIPQEDCLVQQNVSDDNIFRHASWLGCDWQTDAEQTRDAIGDVLLDWLVVDHYSLDASWESSLKLCCKKLMVIDDLADRSHDCDLLLDQNYYNDMAIRYNKLTPPHCKYLTGPRYALLRPEFKDMRRRIKMRGSYVERIFIFFGGSDPTNETKKILIALQLLGIKKIKIDVIIGSTNPHMKEIERICEERPEVTVRIQVSNIAELMGNADLAIGASGSATWERCCVGVPSLVWSIAENQVAIAESANEIGVCVNLGKAENVSVQIAADALNELLESKQKRIFLEENSLNLVDGQGTTLVVEELLSI